MIQSNLRVRFRIGVMEPTSTTLIFIKMQPNWKSAMSATGAIFIYLKRTKGGLNILVTTIRGSRGSHGSMI